MFRRGTARRDSISLKNEINTISLNEDRKKWSYIFANEIMKYLEY